MEHGDKIILVAGATGRQGGASSRHLLQEGWHVRALTRHPDGEAARELERLGAEIVQGDLLDRASIDRAVSGCYGVHSVETFREAGAEGEVTEGRNLIEAADAAGVQHFVYDSVVGAGLEHPGEPWVATKHRIEQYVRDSNMHWTIWRPVTFMENFLRQRDSLAAGVLKGYEPPDMRHQYIAVDDIGRFVALAFDDLETWHGKTTLIAGDDLRLRQVAELLGRVMGHDVRYEQEQPPPGMESAAAGQPERADVASLRRLLPGLETLEQWARSVQWATQPAGAAR